MDESVDRIGELVERRNPSYVITANLNYVMLHHELSDMPIVTQDAALVLADGQPIVWRSRLSSHSLPERVAGSEMIFRLAERARDRGWSIYFLGGEPGVAQQCASRLVQAYPGLRIAGVEAPPFRELTDDEKQQQVARITASGADLLLVAFGQPKGEKWIHRNYQRLKVPVSIQLGASFDFVAGRSKRAPRVWQRIGMEWAYRMSSDPKRLVPRYWANAKFLFKAIVRDLRRDQQRNSGGI
jgi:N-acetylglucosaminyldiphosphoundecaprenol N-acetyl-beta-D-mannosaminyltransferase